MNEKLFQFSRSTKIEFAKRTFFGFKFRMSFCLSSCHGSIFSWAIWVIVNVCLYFDLATLCSFTCIRMPLLTETGR